MRVNPSHARRGMTESVPDVPLMNSVRSKACGWFPVRGSNTEPIIRVVAEAASEAQARDIIGTVFAQVETCINS